MQQHLFLFKPGVWLGEGKIHLSNAGEHLPFVTRWLVPKKEEGGVKAVQEIQISSLADLMQNQFTISQIGKESFQIELENQSLGKVIGKGRINKEVVSWEFRLPNLGFEGFEFYEKTKEKDVYLMHAEYATMDDFRTIIHGKIWRKEEKK
jgi:hypothetical protein